MLIFHHHMIHFTKKTKTSIFSHLLTLKMSSEPKFSRSRPGYLSLPLGQLSQAPSEGEQVLLGLSALLLLPPQIRVRRVQRLLHRGLPPHQLIQPLFLLLNGPTLFPDFQLGTSHTGVGSGYSVALMSSPTALKTVSNKLLYTTKTQFVKINKCVKFWRFRR